MKKLKAIVALLIAFHLFAGPTWAAIVCNAETSDNSNTTDPSTMAYTPDAGSDRIMIFAGSLQDAEADNSTCVSVSSDTSGALTVFGIAREETDTSDDTVSCLYYTTAITDGAQTITWNHTGTITRGVMVAYTCTGVNTASPWRGAAVTTTGDSNTMSSGNVASAVNDLVVDHGTWISVAVGETPAIGAGQTSMYTLAAGTDNMDVVGSTEPGIAGNVTMSWTTTASDPWAQVSGSLVPASASGVGPFHRRLQ